MEKSSSSLEDHTKSPVKDLDTHHEKYLQRVVFRGCLEGDWQTTECPTKTGSRFPGCFEIRSCELGLSLANPIRLVNKYLYATIISASRFIRRHLGIQESRRAGCCRGHLRTRSGNADARSTTANEVRCHPALSYLHDTYPTSGVAIYVLSHRHTKIGVELSVLTARMVTQICCSFFCATVFRRFGCYRRAARFQFRREVRGGGGGGKLSPAV